MEKNGFHQPENQFPPAIISFFFENCLSPTSNNGYHQQKNSSDEKNTVSTRQKIRFHYKIIFQKLDFHQQKKNVQIKEYCFKQTENRYSLAGMENLFMDTFPLDEKIANIGRNI